MSLLDGNVGATFIYNVHFLGTLHWCFGDPWDLTDGGSLSSFFLVLLFCCSSVLYSKVD
jgi:hypothetical protein